jgi:hypothetical protein
MTTYSASDIALQFPFSSDDVEPIATVDSKPTFTSLTNFQKALNANALSVPSTRGGGKLGHLALVISPRDYNSVSDNTIFEAPPVPAPAPFHEERATAAQITETNRQYEITRNEYSLYINTNQALKNFVLNNVPHRFLAAKRHPITQFAQVSTLALMTHLWTQYGRVTTDDLIANAERMNAPWTPPTPIESLYEQLIEGKSFALKGNEQINDSTLVRIGYNLIKSTGLFEVACRQWRQSVTDHSFSNFQSFFTSADEDRRQNDVTTSDKGFSANSLQELIQSELASILTTNNIMMNQMPPPPMDTATQHINDENRPPPPPPSDSANATLTLNDVKDLIQQMMKNQPPPSVVKGSKPDANSGPIKLSYCWSHGTTTNLNHNSQTCNYKKEGHKDEATINNRMGGSNNRQRAKASGNK